MLPHSPDDIKPFMAIVACYAVGMILARPNQQNIAVSMADTWALGMYLGVNSTAFAIGKSSIVPMAISEIGRGMQ